MKSPVHLPLFVLALLLGLLGPAAAGVRINEFLASNRSTLADEDGDFEDWIEFHNPTAHAVDLAEWALSDNPATPFKWTFAAETVIPPGGYLLVWASGKDRPGGGLPVAAPDELDGLVVWLRADTASYSAGQAVDTWSDSSGSGNHATQPLPTQRPTFVANAVNGLPALGFNRFESQQLFLPTSGFSGMQDFSDFTFLAVARWTGGTTSGLFGGYRGSNNTNSGSTVFEIPSIGGNLRLRLPGAVDMTASAAVTQNQWHVLGTIMNGPAAAAYVFRDGETVASASGTPGATWLANYERFPIGSSFDDARTFGGQVAEVAIFNRGLPQEERAGLERHFIAKYNLPVADSGAPTYPHANFSIAAAGETLSLTRPDGSTADQIGPVALAADVPYGRTLENPAVWAMLETATPGAPNDSPLYIEPPAPVTFSHSSGVHQSDFLLTLSHSDPETTIIYTLDGSEPDMNNLSGTTYEFRSYYNDGPLLPQSFTSLSYTGPIPVIDRSPEPNKISLIPTTGDSNPSYLPASPIKKATVVRARAYRDGKAGRTAAATFFVSSTGAFDYPVPLVSLAFEEDGFFDYHNGIYVAGVDRVTSSGGRICGWGNFNRRGGEAERPGHFQYFENGELAVDQGVGFRIHGNCSRGNAFKSLRVHANDTYDPRDEFDYPFFDTPVPDAAFPENNLHKRLILRTPSINEVAFSRLYQPVYGGVGGRLEPVVTFFNGEYWGLSYLRDRLDQRYLARQYNLDQDNITLVNIKYGHEVGSGALRVFNLDAGIPSDMDDFWAMRRFITGNNMADPARYADAEALLDMESFIDHLILKIFAGDDHYAPEYIFWRAREPEDDAFGDGRWRVMVKDFDSTLVTANYVTGLATGTHPRPFGYELFASLLANTSFRNDFINRFADLLNAHFQPARFQQVIHYAYDEAAPIWGEMAARWNNVALNNPSRPFTSALRDSLINWSNQHPPRQRQHIRQHFGISSDVNLTVDVSDPDHGHVRVNTLDIVAETPGIATQPYPWTGVYFHNVPVTLSAVPAANHRFRGWKPGGGRTIFSTDPTLTITPTAATRVEAVFEKAFTLHEWTFENPSTYIQPDYSIGGAALAIAPGPTTEVLRSAAAQGFDSGHLRVNSPLGSVVNLTVPTTNFEKIALSFLTRRSGQGAGLQTLSYTLNGTVWTAVETYPAADSDPSEESFDLSAVSGASDNPQFGVRITFAQGEGGTAGNNRFDDIIVTGVPLPGANLPPIRTDQLPGRIDLVEGAPSILLDPAPWFADPNGDPLVFTASSSRPAQASAAITGGQLALGGVQRGESVVALTADDGHNPPVATTIRILVHPAPHLLGSGAIAFTAWDANAPEHTYPPHMLFLQGVEDDSTLESVLDRAYHIPHYDYAEADLATLGFPYNNTARTRVDGLGQDGIAFINTGRGRDLGGALLALDTTGLNDARVAFTAGTVLPNTRVYAIRLQYRTGASGPFMDLTDGGGQPVEYVRNAGAGHSAVLGPIDLPPAALDQPYVQLLWRYNHLEGTSGPRAQLRLDGVMVTSETGEPATYAQWRNLYFSDPTEHADDAISGPYASAAGDDFANLVRYAHGIGPHDSLDALLPHLDSAVGSGPVYHLRLATDKSDLAWLVNASADLVDWTETLFDSRVDPAPPPDAEGWSAIPVPADRSRLFLRLELMLIAP